VALGIDEGVRREVLAVELANRASGSSRKDFLSGLRAPGLYELEFVVSDDHHGIKAVLRQVMPEAARQRCSVHFLRNALDRLPRKVDDDCLQELRWLFGRCNRKEAQQDLAAWLKHWESRYRRLTDRVEENIGETLTFYRLPRQHHKHLRSTNVPERLNEEIKRRTRVVRIFPDPESCLRLILALCGEVHESRIEENPCLNMDLLREQRKQALREAA
jgi:transposase-like protein